MSWEAARILNVGETMKPQAVNKLTTAAFRAFENIGTSSQGNCDSELIRQQEWNSFLAHFVLLPHFQCASSTF